MNMYVYNFDLNSSLTHSSLYLDTNKKTFSIDDDENWNLNVKVTRISLTPSICKNSRSPLLNSYSHNLHYSHSFFLNVQ